MFAFVTLVVLGFCSCTGFQFEDVLTASVFSGFLCPQPEASSQKNS